MKDITTFRIKNKITTMKETELIKKMKEMAENMVKENAMPLWISVIRNTRDDAVQIAATATVS